jgi:hypothetical protein
VGTNACIVLYALTQLARCFSNAVRCFASFKFGSDEVAFAIYRTSNAFMLGLIRTLVALSCFLVRGYIVTGYFASKQTSQLFCTNLKQYFRGWGTQLHRRDMKVASHPMHLNVLIGFA